MRRILASVRGRMDPIERLMRERKWAAAERQIQSRLHEEPDFHWLWERLSASRYQQRDYDGALRCAQKTLKIMPSCSLAMWDKAQALYNLGRYSDAIDAFQAILRRGVRRLVREPCSEGPSRSKALISDSYYRLARAYAHSGNPGQAVRALRKSLAMRGPGVRPVCPTSDVKALLKQLTHAAEPLGRL
jgi:tetratricopeptide (TPR) repeat protein